MHDPKSYADAVKAEHREIGGMVRRIREAIGNTSAAGGSTESAERLLRQGFRIDPELPHL